MREITRRHHRGTVGVAGGSIANEDTAVAFVPCLVCLSPIDFERIRAAERPPLCSSHRAPDFVPLYLSSAG